MKSQQIAVEGKPPDEPLVKVKEEVVPEKATLREAAKILGSLIYWPRIKATATSSDLVPLA